MPRVTLTPAFKTAFADLPKDRQKRAAKALRLFMENERYPGLHFERLQGAETYHSIRASLSDRILLRFVEEDLYEAVDVGGHEVYRALKR